MKIKRAVSNLLILVTPRGTTAVCTGKKFESLDSCTFQGLRNVTFLVNFA